MFGDSLADKLGKFWILSSSPSRLGTPRSAQGWHWKAGGSAGLSDKRNTERCTQEPSLFGGRVALSTQLGREKNVTTCQRIKTKQRVMEGTKYFKEACLGCVCFEE